MLRNNSLRRNGKPKKQTLLNFFKPLDKCTKKTDTTATSKQTRIALTADQNETKCDDDDLIILGETNPKKHYLMEMELDDDLLFMGEKKANESHASTTAATPTLSTMIDSQESSQNSFSGRSSNSPFNSFGTSSIEMTNTSRYNFKTFDPLKVTGPRFSSQEVREPEPEPERLRAQKRVREMMVGTDNNGSSSNGSMNYKRKRMSPSPFSSQTSQQLSGYSSSPTTSEHRRVMPPTFSTQAPKQTSTYSSSMFSSTSNSYQYNSSSFFNKPSKESGAKRKYTKTAKVPSFASKEDREYRPELSPEQQRVVDMVVNDQQNMFFTGSAGTGKSVLLRALIDRLKETYGDGVAVTASTGIAACNISGSTLHSFTGIGLGKESVERLIEKIGSNSKICSRWRRTKVLIVDEISMVDGELFDKIERIASTIRTNPKPFGGIQLVLTGDFFQLPPVNQYGTTKFAFEAQSWSQVVQKTVMLKHVFRQKDQEFVDILNEMRLGKLSQNAINIFKSLSREPVGKSSISPTELFPLRSQVESANNTRLQALEGNDRVFTATDTGDKTKVDSCIAPAAIRLKHNAQVMLLKNMDATLVNGSLGIVVGFVGEGRFTSRRVVKARLAPTRKPDEIENIMDTIMSRSYPVVRFADDREIVIETERWTVELPGGKEIASRTQLPLMLAWAMSIHKSQGQTLDRVRVDLGRVFEKGQAYVALSRARSIETLQILNFDPTKVMAHPKVTNFYRTFQSV